MVNSFDARQSLQVNGRQYGYYKLGQLSPQFDIQRLPFSLKVLLENLLRHENGVDVTRADIEALAQWEPQAQSSTEIAFTPARVILQDFTGVPALVDLAAMRDAVKALGGDPRRVNPLSPVELVIDHSVQVDVSADPRAREENVRKEYERNRERYEFLSWGQHAFDNFKVVPPGAGIVHQVNLEHLARVVFETQSTHGVCAYPDTVVGTDSHTTMINGLGVLGWGVGGIEAEAAMLGQPVTMLIPQVVGFRLTGSLPQGATATDLVLTVVERLRELGVVGKFVEFFGDGLRNLPLADRATLANMAPEYGATCGLFPIDEETLRYLSMSARSPEQVSLVAAYAHAQGLFYRSDECEALYSETLELDMSTVRPCISGPKRPQDRIALDGAGEVVRGHLTNYRSKSEHNSANKVKLSFNGASMELVDGAVVIAAITSCTNTSNPAVMIGAGLLAKNAVAKGLTVKPWVKTSLAPGSLVVERYLDKAALLDDLQSLGFHIVGFGCTTCIGNSGPLPESIHKAIHEHDVVACAVLSGNRNFEGRIHSDVKMNFLASPPLVVAYAIAGNMQVDLVSDPLGHDDQGEPVYLRDIWPSSREIDDVMRSSIESQMYENSYASIFDGDALWRSISTSKAERYEWDMVSTYVRNPPYFENMTMQAPGIARITNARALALLGDSITTDHISPAGAIASDSPAGEYLSAHQVQRSQFNSYGARRGNHEVMMRGTFANVRLRNLLAPGTEGGCTVHQPSGEQMTIFEAAMRYQQEGVPLVVFGGVEYGTGSSRDWAAKGTLLLGVKAVVAVSFERIHRSNLIGMGVLPLQFLEGESAQSLELEPHYTFDVDGLSKGATQVVVVARDADGIEVRRFDARVRIDTPKEWEYYEHGGILHYVVRQLVDE